MTQWYEDLFENYALQYDKESFTQGTKGECDFIEQEINHDKQARILDLGCGTGRHSIEMTMRGYKRITGVDLSDSQLKRTYEKAKEKNLIIDFRKHDARELPFHAEFDLVMMICEGAFPLMETDEMNFLILENVSKAMKKGGKLIFTTLNGLFPLFHSVKEFIEGSSKESKTTSKNNSFDLMTFRDESTVIVEDDMGNKKELICNERYYVPSEITWMLKSLGFKKIDIFGAKLGAFSRNDRLTTEDFEMLVVATL